MSFNSRGFFFFLRIKQNNLEKISLVFSTNTLCVFEPSTALCWNCSRTKFMSENKCITQSHSFQKLSFKAVKGSSN